jgi:hypothetical protein
MKKFYIINGQNQEGPFDIEQFKSLNIKRDTPVWYEGIENWTTAEKVEDLKSLLPKTAIPPKYEIPIDDNIASTPPKFNIQEEKKETPKRNTDTSKNESIESNKNNSKRSLIIGGGVLLVLLLIGIILSNSNSNGYGGSSYPATANPEATAVEVSDADEAVSAAEYERQNANSALTEKNMNYRNNFEKYLTLSRNGYQSRTIGGIFNLEITFTNNTDYVIDNVNVQIGYIQENGDYFKTETIQFTNVQPNTQETLPAPDSERGLSVDYQFTEIYSKKMHFYYPSDSGNNEDPYFYKQ